MCTHCVRSVKAALVMLEGRLRPDCVYSLCAERESGAGDAGGQVEALADLAP